MGRVKSNWVHLVNQHASKARYICDGKNCLPERKEDISQQRIFTAQLDKYLAVEDAVAILGAFPLFLFDYFKEIR